MALVRPSIIAIIFGVLAFLWTAAGETSDPVLHVNELPHDIVAECGFIAAADPSATCRIDDYSQRWINTTSRGQLFFIASRSCVGIDMCRTWFVEKASDGVTVLLSVDGRFRLQRSKFSYPSIQTHTVLSNNQSSYSVFKWNGEEYSRTDSKVVYHIEGIECGTAVECESAARTAVKNRDFDKAVKIWETVHGVSWI